MIATNFLNTHCTQPELNCLAQILRISPADIIQHCEIPLIFTPIWRRLNSYILSNKLNCFFIGTIKCVRNRSSRLPRYVRRTVVPEAWQRNHNINVRTRVGAKSRAWDGCPLSLVKIHTIVGMRFHSNLESVSISVRELNVHWSWMAIRLHDHDHFLQ